MGELAPIYSKRDGELKEGGCTTWRGRVHHLERYDVTTVNNGLPPPITPK